MIFALQHGDATRIGELSQQLGVAARTMTSTVQAMERDGLVTRRPDPLDGRATVVALTDKGRQVFAETRKIRGAVLDDLFDRFDEGERRALLATLARLQAVVTDDIAGLRP